MKISIADCQCALKQKYITLKIPQWSSLKVKDCLHWAGKCVKLCLCAVLKRAKRRVKKHACSVNILWINKFTSNLLFDTSSFVLTDPVSEQTNICRFGSWIFLTQSFRVKLQYFHISLVCYILLLIDKTQWRSPRGFWVCCCRDWLLSPGTILPSNSSIYSWANRNE